MAGAQALRRRRFPCCAVAANRVARVGKPSSRCYPAINKDLGFAL